MVRHWSADSGHIESQESHVVRAQRATGAQVRAYEPEPDPRARVVVVNSGLL